MRHLLLFLALVVSVAAQPSRPVDLKFREVDMRDALRIAARLAGRNILLAPEVKGKLTLDLAGVEPLKAIELLAAVNRYELIEREGILIVGDPNTIAFVRGAGTVETLTLRYGDAQELAEKLSRLYKGKVAIEADPRTNSLLITRPGK